MTEGNRIKEVRGSLGLTLEQFGNKLGVTKVAISNIEKGNRNVTEQMRKAICREYNVNYDWLITGQGEMFSNVPQTILDKLCLQYNLDDEDRALVDIYVSLPTEFRQLLKTQIKEKLINPKKTSNHDYSDIPDSPYDDEDEDADMPNTN